MHTFFEHLKTQKILPIFRLPIADLCLKLCQLAVETHFEIVEITLNTPDALKIIRQLSQEQICIGAGTILNANDAEKALDAGAQFIVSPGLSTAVAHLCTKYQTPYIPGVFTPTEIMLARELGLKVLKLFPASTVGPEYIKHLKGPFGDMEFLPTGGIDLTDVSKYLEAGALAVGQGTRLVSKQALMDENWETISKNLEDIQTYLQDFI